MLFLCHPGGGVHAKTEEIQAHQVYGEDLTLRYSHTKDLMGKAGFFRPYSYVLDEFYDCVICPENHILNYATTNREGYREFKSKGYSCALCPSIEHCTESAKHEKLVTKHDLGRIC